MTKLIEITGKAIAGEWGDDDLTGSGIPVLRTTNFTNIGVVSYDNVVTRIIKKKNLKDKLLRYGDIIIEKSGGSDTQPVGRVIFFEGEEEKYLFNNFTGLLRVKDRDLWNPKYVFYTLFANYAMGRTVPYENRTTGLHNLQTDSYVNATEVINRGIDDQNKIVKHLDKVVKLINLHKEQLKDLDAVIKSRFIEMFGDPVKNSVNDCIVKLDSLGVWQSGGTPSRSIIKYFQGDIDWYSAGELNSLYLQGSKEHITEEAINNSSAKIFKAGSLLVGMYDTAAFKMGILTKDSSSNQACACIEPYENVNVIWLYHILQYMKEYFLSNRRGVRQKNLNLGMIKSFEIPFAPLELQNQFAAFVAQVDKSKLAVQQSLNELETLKKSLMQQYFG